MKIEINLTEEQIFNGIDMNYIYWSIMNRYGHVYPMMMAGDRYIEIDVGEMEEPERIALKEYIETMIERREDMFIEDKADMCKITINMKSIVLAIRQAIIEHDITDLKVFYYPKATGCLDKGTLINYQRFYFSRKLTTQEKSAFANLVTFPMDWIEYG